MKTALRVLALCATSLISTTVLADQCAWVSSAQAAKALDHLKPGSTYVEFCEPCGDKNFFRQKPQALRSVLAEINSDKFWEISLNGKGVDLAYTFVRTQDGSYLNVSKLANCPSHDVSAGFSPNKK